ncbi:MAG: transcription elongation factor GreA [Erysipelotrichaceae bacterium]
MAQKKVLVTQKGLDALETELNNLIHVIRKEVIIELQEARAQGDLSENADYDAARDHQARVEQRIHELEGMLANVELISDDNADVNLVKLGSTVTIKDMGDNTEEVYTIVGSVESDPLNGKLSNMTPLAIAIFDHRVGDVVSVANVDEPYKVKILNLK